MENFTKIPSSYKILTNYYTRVMFYEYVKFCPVCGYKFKSEDFLEEVKLHNCKQCGFHYYHNMIPTSSAIIPKKNEPNTVLLTRRNQNPHKGKLDTPGGFYQYSERVEDGIDRELEEELGIKLAVEKIFGIKINSYKYQQYEYKHTTIYFLMNPIDHIPNITDKKENSEVIFFNLEELGQRQEEFAFEGDFKILKEYKSSLSK